MDSHGTANLLVVILSQHEYLAPILDAWHSIGVPGITILRSAGASRAPSWLHWLGVRDPDPQPAADAMTQHILLAAIKEDDMLERAMAEAERVVGGFDRPFSGVMFVMPITAAAGLRSRSTKRPPRRLPPAVMPDWMVTRDTKVEVAADVFDLQPAIVSPDMPLDEVARRMVAQPAVHVACVVDGTGRLVGVIDLHALADDLFFHIVPEEFLSEVSDIEEALQFAAKSGMRTAADAMQPPAYVLQGRSVRDAFRAMHDHRLSGLPIVDQRHRVVGYVNLLELLSACSATLAGAPSRGEDQP